MSKPPVSVCIPTYNDESTIRASLDALVNLDYPTYEVIIIDSSDDKTPEIIKEYSDQDSSIRLIRQEKNGIGAARDRGLNEAKYDIIAYTDADAKVEKSWLSQLVPPLKDPDVGATTGRTIYETNETCTSWLRKVNIDLRNRYRKNSTRLAAGPSCAFRREVLEEVGGFDHNWPFAEDSLASSEIISRGYEIRYVSDAKVHHVPEGDWRTYLRKSYQHAKTYAELIVRHPENASRNDFIPLHWKIQPPIFVVILLTIPFVGLFWPVGLFIWLGMFGLGASLNIPFAVRVAAQSKEIKFFPQSMGLTTARGLCWGAGSIVGGVHNLSVLLGAYTQPKGQR